MRHAATIAANYHHVWGKYGLNVNLNGRLQSKTYYPGYEDAPGFGIWNLHTTHSFDVAKWAFLEPSIGVDNLFDKVDRRIDSSQRKYALYSPGRMLVVGLKVRFKDLAARKTSPPPYSRQYVRQMPSWGISIISSLSNLMSPKGANASIRA